MLDVYKIYSRRVFDKPYHLPKLKRSLRCGHYSEVVSHLGLEANEVAFSEIFQEVIDQYKKTETVNEGLWMLLHCITEYRIRMLERRGENAPRPSSIAYSIYQRYHDEKVNYEYFLRALKQADTEQKRYTLVQGWINEIKAREVVK